jgi:hypothetical protein
MANNTCLRLIAVVALGWAGPVAAQGDVEAPVGAEPEALGPGEAPKDEDQGKEDQDKNDADTSDGKKGKGKGKGKDKTKKPKVTGFIQTFFRYAFETGSDGIYDPPNFRVQRVRVALEGDVNKWVGYDVSIDPRAPEIGGVLRDAYITIKKVIPHHRIRIGQQKTQFGYENPESSTRLYAVNRSEVSDNLSRGLTLRDIGVGILGKWPLGCGWRLEDALTITNGARMNAQADDTRRKSYWGRVGGRWDREPFLVRFGVSGGIGDFAEPADPTIVPPEVAQHVVFKRLGADIQLDSPWAFVSAEYVWGRDRVSFEAMPTETNDETGYYINLVGKTPYRVGPIVRFDVLGDEHQRWTLGAYYGLVEDRIRVMINYEYRRLMDIVRGDDKLYLWTQVRF